MLLRRLTEHVKDQNWFAVVLDFVIVVAGILIAFQIANWSEARTIAQKEGQLIARLASDLESMREGFKRDDTILLPIHDGWVHAFRALETCKVTEAHSESINFAFSQYQRSFSPSIHRAAFDEMQSTGAFSRLPDEELQNELTTLYSQLDGTTAALLGGRNNQLAAGRIMWKYIAFSFVEEKSYTADTDTWGTAAFNPLDHCDNLELRGAIWEMVDTNRDNLNVNLTYVNQIDRILLRLQEQQSK